MTSFAQAIVNVESGGGGNAEYYTGTIAFNDTEATSITFPVSVGSSDRFLFEFLWTRSGTVTDGVVAYDNERIKEAYELITGGWGKRRETGTFRAGGLKPIIANGYISYAHSLNGAAGLVHETNKNALTFETNATTFTPSDTSYGYFCHEGKYTEYTYHFFVFRG